MFVAGAEGDLCSNIKSALQVCTGINADEARDVYQCVYLWQSVLYFVSFDLFGTSFMINIFVAVVLDTQVDNVEIESKMDTITDSANTSTVNSNKSFILSVNQKQEPYDNFFCGDTGYGWNKNADKIFQ